MSPSDLVYTIGSDDTITAVSPEWNEFAALNDGPDGASVIGHVLWRFMEGPAIADIWRRLVARARGGAAVQALIRCDAPALKRRVAISARAAASGAVTFTTRVVAQAERPEIRLLDARAPRSEDAVRICAWCHSIAVGEDWIPLEDGVRLLGLMDAVALPRLTHGICEHCLEVATAPSSG